ncbi:AfsR/SARP family transcriptional regulator [Amycolatopsis aidingensis]|uniref:AfsR/SARP family transcriptional regulator n=1 Tax=Amycolatopsis aidingensis TaxID=2842453 RepID=UPI001C0C3F5C|nr:AfsR/SARP family transcriptional regulator [Amycolatopsis aidingensis]
MEFRLLGPMEAVGATGPVALRGVKPRALLAALLLERGRTVPVDRLIEVVWGDDPPPTARAVLQTYVATLRRTLNDAGLPQVIASDRYGYRAEVPDNAVDARVFERHVEQGRLAAHRGEHDEAAQSFRAGLTLWRGPALGDLGESFLRAEAARLGELRLTVVEERIGADLAAGQGPGLLAELTELVTLHPTRERLRGGLMTALYRAGRQADALEVYQRGRQALQDELGIDPGPELSRLHEAILRGDPALLPAAPRPARQLPSPPADFIGRDAEIAALSTALVRPDTMPIGVISGAGGMGKSTLAHRVAHELADHFPDGQYHLELHGSTASPAGAEQLLARLLRDIDPLAAQPPGSLDEWVARYRTRLAGTRTLVVLDDAATEAQVRPLLPGSPGCAVIVTSRNRLSALAGATFTELGVLPEDAATGLLARIAGADRVSAESAAATEITRLCGRLPLAIRVAGARLVSRRQWSLARLVDRLADERHRLNELTVGDQQVGASINLSYALLPRRARTTLRRLGLLSLPSFNAWVAAAAMAVGLDEAERVLEDLVDVSLVEIEGTDPVGLIRYRLHDLISLFALERAMDEEPPADRAAAVERVLGGWIWLVERINEDSTPHLPSVQAEFRLGRAVDQEVARRVVARPYDWFRAEEDALIVAIERAAAMGLDGVAVELAAALSGTAFGGHHRVFDNPFGSWQRTHDAALTAARGNGNVLGEAALLAGLGQLYYELDDYPRSRGYLSDALSVFRAAGDARGEATALAALGAACREQGYLPEALHFLERAKQQWAGLSDPGAMGHARRLAGTVRLEMGDYPGALDDLTEALALFTEAGSRRGEGLALRNLSLYHRARDEWTRAAELARAALTIFEQTEDRLLVAYSKRALGKALLRLGDPVAAESLVADALAVARALGDPFGHACGLWVMGEVRLVDGRLYQARDCLEDSLRRWTDLRSELFRARTVHTLAKMHQALGDGPTAQRLTAEAMETFRTYGAREYAESSGG